VKLRLLAVGIAALLLAACGDDVQAFYASRATQTAARARAATAAPSVGPLGRATAEASSTAALAVPGGGVPPTGIAFVSTRDGNQELYLIQADGSGLARLTDHPAIDSDPSWSADGRQIAFRSRRDGTTDIFVMSVDDLAPVNLIGDAFETGFDEFAPCWSPDGTTLALITDRFQLHWADGCSGHVVALMPATGGGKSIRRAETVKGNQRSVAWSPDGQYLAFSSHCGSDTVIHLYLLDVATGHVRRLTEDPSRNIYPAWSHDGRYLAFSSTRDGNSEVYLLELETGALRNLTQNPAKDIAPTWSPDDEQIAFCTDRDGNSEVYVMNADGSNLRNLTKHPAYDGWPAWSSVP
jgi:Tol biopolymer transport system component